MDRQRCGTETRNEVVPHMFSFCIAVAVSHIPELDTAIVYACVRARAARACREGVRLSIHRTFDLVVLQTNQVRHIITHIFYTLPFQ